VSTLRTHRLELFAADAVLSRAALKDHAQLGRLLEATVPAAWTPAPVAEGEASRLEQDPEAQGWLSWYVVRVGRARTLVGVCGLAGPPGETGEVTLRYAILPGHEGKGYATEAVGALIDWAFSDERTRAIVAHTEERLPASIRVMVKNGLTLEHRDGERLTFALRRKV
jgi:ribosomal-protein-alanine N-acetyltransferase